MEIKLVKWVPHKRPMLDICPEEFCFFWREKGDSYAPGLYKNIDEALINAEPVLWSYCGCPFGECVRQNDKEDKSNLKDWYEPVEPELDAYKLPWFYFVNPNKLSLWKRLIYKMYFRKK